MATNPIKENAQVFPRMSQPLEASGLITLPWYQLLRSLFNRTGAESGLVTFTTDDSGDSAAGAALESQMNFVTSSGNAVQLSPYTHGQIQLVFNVVPSVALSVKPPSGARINALGVDVAYVMNPGGAIAAPTFQLFAYQTATQLWTLTLG